MLRRNVHPRRVLSEDLDKFREATRKLLFKEEPGIPGEGQAADAAPERHLRVKVTMNLDGDIIRHFKERAKNEGRAYQMLMNDALREQMEGRAMEKVAREVGLLLLEDPSFLERIRERLK